MSDLRLDVPPVDRAGVVVEEERLARELHEIHPAHDLAGLGVDQRVEGPVEDAPTITRQASRSSSPEL